VASSLRISPVKIAEALFANLDKVACAAAFLTNLDYAQHN
jgi:hypothetical protein